MRCRKGTYLLLVELFCYVALVSVFMITENRKHLFGERNVSALEGVNGHDVPQNCENHFIVSVV